jgi:hypothetical protein
MYATYSAPYDAIKRSWGEVDVASFRQVDLGMRANFGLQYSTIKPMQTSFGERKCIWSAAARYD